MMAYIVLIGQIGYICLTEHYIEKTKKCIWIKIRKKDNLYNKWDRKRDLAHPLQNFHFGPCESTFPSHPIPLSETARDRYR